MSNSFGVSGQSMARVNYRGADSILLNQAIRSAAAKAAVGEHLADLFS